MPRCPVLAAERKTGGLVSDIKKWGADNFWGLGFEFDPQWVLTPAQKELQAKLIELYVAGLLCGTLRVQADPGDRTEAGQPNRHQRKQGDARQHLRVNPKTE